MLKKLLKSMVAIVLCGSLVNSSLVSAEELKKIKIGASPNVVDVVGAMTDSLEKLGYELEVVSFDDTILPNTALAEKSIDANLYQHEPFLNAYNEEHDTDLYFVKPLFGGFTALYSEKYDKLEDIPENAKIGIFDDSSNQHRALVLAQEAGLIKLKEKAEGELYSVLDIEENPKNIDFKPLQSKVLVTSIGEMDAIFAQGTSMFLAEKDPSSYLVKESDNKPYGIGLVVNPEDKDAEWIEDVIKAFQTDDTKQKIEDRYKGSYVFFD